VAGQAYPKQKNTKAGPAEGILYFLPTGVLEIDVTRRLAKCGGTPDKPDVDFEISVASALKFEADRSKPYLLDYEALEKGFKEIDLAVELYENGTLKSVNAKITDRTAEAVTNALQGAARIVKMAMGLMSLNVGPGVCTNDATTALAAYNAAASLRKQKLQELDKLLVKDPKTDEDLKTVASLKGEVANADSVIARSLQVISWTEKYIWRPSFDSSCRATLTLAPNETRLRKLSTLADIEKNSSLAVLIKDPDSNGDEGVMKDVAANPRRHLVYRAPAKARLYVCRDSESCANKNAKCDSLPPRDAVLLEQPVLLPQAGARFALPLKNRLFDGQTLSATFRPSGTIEQVKYTSAAEAAAATKAFNDATREVGGLVSAARGEKLADIKAQTELINAQIALQKAKDELARVTSAPPD
jgi:hypothetical protein